MSRHAFAEQTQTDHLCGPTALLGLAEQTPSERGFECQAYPDLRAWAGPFSLSSTTMREPNRSLQSRMLDSDSHARTEQAVKKAKQNHVSLPRVRTRRLASQSRAHPLRITSELSRTEQELSQVRSAQQDLSRALS